MKISQYMDLPKKMNSARIKAGLTQSYLAQKLGISQQSYAKYENGMTEPSLESLELFCREVHMTVPELLGIIDPTTSNAPITSFSQWLYTLKELENHGIIIDYDVENAGLGCMTGVYRINQTQIATIALVLKDLHNRLNQSQISRDEYNRKIEELMSIYNVPISEYIDSPNIEEKKSLLHTIKKAVLKDDD